MQPKNFLTGSGEQGVERGSLAEQTTAREQQKEAGKLVEAWDIDILGDGRGK